MKNGYLMTEDDYDRSAINYKGLLAYLCSQLTYENKGITPFIITNCHELNQFWETSKTTMNTEVHKKMDDYAKNDFNMFPRDGIKEQDWQCLASTFLTELAKERMVSNYDSELYTSIAKETYEKVKEYQQAYKKKNELIYSALSKLTIEERKALGIKE